MKLITLSLTVGRDNNDGSVLLALGKVPQKYIQHSQCINKDLHVIFQYLSQCPTVLSGLSRGSWAS